MAISAGVIRVMGFPAVLAMPGLTAEFGCSASHDLPHGLAVAGQEIFLMLLIIIGTVLAKDVRQGVHRIRMTSLRMCVGSSISCLMSRV